MPVRVYITGIAGFIGSTAAGQLVERGHDVRGCDDLSMGKAENVPEGAAWLEADCRQLDALNTDVLLHLAAMACARWPDDNEVWQRNLAATAHLARIHKGRMVFASTCVAPNPLLGAYAGSKWACENILPDATICRFGNVYGPRQRDWGPEPGVLAAWQKAEAAGEPIRIDGDGTQTRDFIHVDDVARALCLAVENDAADGQTIDICTGIQTPVIELADKFDAPRTYAPRNPVDPDSMPQNPEPASRLLGFESEIVL
jgi:UDP-glucose 4-epimerase